MLLIRPSALGDVCRTVPVLASLRAAWPGARIDWLVQDSFVEAVRHHPAFGGGGGAAGGGGVVSFPRRALGAAGPVEQVRWMNRTLRAEGAGRGAGVRGGVMYDVVIDAQGLARSGVFARWTGAAVRAGLADAREGAALAYTHRMRTRAVHTVDRMLAVVRGLGLAVRADMRLWCDPAELEWAQGDARLGGGYVVLAPTSRWAAKRWPAARWVALAEGLLARGVDRVVVVGGPGEREQCAGLIELSRRDGRVVDLVGATAVGRLMAVIAGAKLVVANDSAAVHMAVGLDRAIVALYGPTDVARVGPYRREEDVIQHVEPGEALGHKDDANVTLMERIGVDEVEAACMARLARGGTA